MTLQARTGLSFDVDDALRGIVTIGWLEADGLTGAPLPVEFERERDTAIERLVRQFAGRQAVDIPGVSETRSMFHRLGVDPTKSRPASEALLRRALQGKGMPSIHSAVDVCNLASLEHQLPIGLYDREHVKQAVFARVGHQGEGYEGIRKGRVNLSNRPLLADEEGPFGAPTSDSARTQVTDATRTLLAVAYCPAERPGEHLSAMLARVSDLLARFCGASVHLVRTLQ